MIVSSSSKKSLKTKQTIDQTYSSQSRLIHAKSQQNLLDKTVDQSKIQQFLMKQLQAARSIIQSYPYPIQSQMMPKTPPANRQSCIKAICQMERQIQIKNQQIENISQQIKNLKSFQKQTFHDGLKNYKTIRNLLFFKLSDQIGHQKDQLICLQKQHKRKKQQVQKSRKIMNQTIQIYSSVINEDTKRIITYQQFINNKKLRNKFQVEIKNKKNSKKYLGIGKISLQMEQNNKKCNILFSTDLKQVQNKKIIAQSALKILKKKHLAEIQELNGKLQFLQEQNQDLQIKLKLKLDQLKTAENRFSQTKQEPNKKPIKVNRYSQPQL